MMIHDPVVNFAQQSLYSLDINSVVDKNSGVDQISGVGENTLVDENSVVYRSSEKDSRRKFGSSPFFRCRLIIHEATIFFKFSGYDFLRISLGTHKPQLPSHF